jgi:hypothetical protein
MRKARHPRFRSLSGGTDRRRRHRFPAPVTGSFLARAVSNSHHPSSSEPSPYPPSGDVDALLWEHAADLVSAASER